MFNKKCKKCKNIDSYTTFNIQKWRKNKIVLWCRKCRKNFSTKITILDISKHQRKTKHE